MKRRLLPMLVLGLVLPALILAADEPPAGPGDGTPRLKRKKRGGDTEPPKTDKKAPDKEPPVPKAKDEEPLVPEDGGPAGEPEEDDKDILERIGKNMRAVEEKLGSRELGEPTRQQQGDILRDIDKLIKKSENPPQGGGGGGGGQPPPQGGNEGQDKQQSKSKSGKGQPKAGKGGMGSMAKGGQKRQPRNQRQPGGSKGNATARNQSNPGSSKSPPQPGSTGNNPGAGGADNPKAPENDRRAINDQWGHLPESLRAEMNAYSNPQPFLPRYDRLIREYYKTIAEQGRKKGD